MQSTIILMKGIRRIAVLSAAGLILCLSGCSKPKRPAGVLDEVKLAAIITDVYIAEAKMNPLRISKDSAMRILSPWEEKIMAKNKVTRKQLKETYRYYLDHPGDFERVYEIVADTLNLREQRGLRVNIKK